VERPNIPDRDYCLVCSSGEGKRAIEEVEEPEEPAEPGEPEEPEERPLARRLLLYAVISLEESAAEAFAWQTAYYH